MQVQAGTQADTRQNRSGPGTPDVVGAGSGDARRRLRPEPRETDVQAAPNPSPARVPLGGYILPPGFGEEQEEAPLLPLGSAAARAAARRASSGETSLQSQEAAFRNATRGSAPPRPAADEKILEAARALEARSLTRSLTYETPPAVTPRSEPASREGGLLSKLLGGRGDASPRKPVRPETAQRTQRGNAAADGADP